MDTTVKNKLMELRSIFSSSDWRNYSGRHFGILMHYGDPLPQSILSLSYISLQGNMHVDAADVVYQVARYIA